MSARAKCRLRLEKLESRVTPSITLVGDPFRVNVPTQDRQGNPAVAYDAAGEFVIAFAGFDDRAPNPGWGIFVRMYDSNGVPRGDQSKVADVPDMFSEQVSVAMNASGYFVVSWTYAPELNSTEPFAVYARKFDGSGAATSAPIQVNQASTADNLFAACAIADNGSFAVSWMSTMPNGKGSDENAIKLRRYSADCAPTTGEMTIRLDGSCEIPVVGFGQNGSLAVLWFGNDYGIRGLIYDASNSVEANLAISGPHVAQQPRFSFKSNGELVVVWQDNNLRSPPVFNEYFQQFTSDGQPIGVSTLLSSPGMISQAGSVAIDKNDGFVICWQDLQPPPPTGPYVSGDVKLRRFDSSGIPTNEAIRISSPQHNEQMGPVVGLAPNGDGVVCWHTNDGNPTSLDVYGQRFLGPNPTIPRTAVNNGAAQRSTVNKVQLNFNRNTVFPADPSVAFDLEGPNGRVPVSVSFAGSTAAGTVATLTFPTLTDGSLTDGSYNLRAIASQLHDTAGQPFDGNGDGTPGDDFVMTVKRLAGDFTGDGRVDLRDFALFRNAINKSDLAYDLDGDGKVDMNDFLVFRAQYGMFV